MTEERAARQRELLTPYIAAADALITTAAVPGRQAPLLVTRDMVARMKPGSVVVDLAADSGGNVEGREPGAVVQIGGVQLWGGANVPSQMPGPASRLYAHNVLNVILLMTREGDVRPRLRRRDRRGDVCRPAHREKTRPMARSRPLQARSEVEKSTSGEFSPREREAGA